MTRGFQSTLPARGATLGDRQCRPPVRFQSTLPARGATPVAVCTVCSADVSIHAPREGSDRRVELDSHNRSSFNPRSPRGERPLCAACQCPAEAFQSTLPARGATDCASAAAEGGRLVSIHAPREGSDWWHRQHCTCAAAFQSTLPARGATGGIGSIARVRRRFNPRSPRGERLVASAALHVCGGVSIHAPREGSDPRNVTCSSIPLAFQSTLPARGATMRCCPKIRKNRVSIHAPREGSDVIHLAHTHSVSPRFNPRSPRGERHRQARKTSEQCPGFNPRSPRGERLTLRV